MLRVLIVDDHPVVREGLRGMLLAEPDIEVVGEAGSADEAVVVARRLRPDVILMDLRMPGGDGIGAIGRLEAGPRVIVLTTYQDEAEIQRALAAGAAGYLLKDVSRPELAAAVRDAARGRTVLAPSVAARPAAPSAGRQAGRPVGPALSGREREVLELVAEGLTNAEIGRRLYIGEATVKTHLLRVFGKLGVSDRTSAVLAALDLGLVRRRT
ncbi:response regulator transcription factor [Nonomuraea jiangxiensis]|uniref:DNA-binding response regulator, NarL/FixJ family, contains REC and HTH domains n=1 Tax=Nonomuraea jiangxiensis TaxID=633440 RepID=A0A1G7YXS0_9ACTN|nr:response regulator transcription factor [Nonomuraea jiangxiensis]SDH01251.1 DNA-binding response regulator, NarL/FixJ family, contains REC and HTH domains [Nonomuraea jiangxiensis]